jgi:hypothetical protein
MLVMVNKASRTMQADLMRGAYALQSQVPHLLKAEVRVQIADIFE